MPRTGVGCLKFATIRNGEKKKKKQNTIQNKINIFETKDAEKDPDLCVQLYQEG